jgi:hypothetical protein
VTRVTVAAGAGTHPDGLSSIRLSFAALVLAVAAQSFAVTYIVPRDRFEIERASAIVVGRVLGSHAEASRFGIETITRIALEEAIKANPDSVFEVHEPGGIIDGEMRVIPGVPIFADGERVLLLLYQRQDGAYTISDLGLGSFRFSKVAGRDLVFRNESEIEGWDGDGKPHEEPQRAAELFLDYIRGIVRGETVTENYVVAKTVRNIKSEALPPVATAAFTATSYMLTYGAGFGTRWNVFPSAVSWNQGNSETGALGTGTSEINAAFGIWAAGGTNYVLSGANANANGFLDATDGVNNFVFEKNLTSAGIQAFSCTSGGALGMGGMTRANFGGGSHIFHGETFGTTLEADVSMNQGLGGCTLGQIPKEMFKSVIVHELGHTLGFRHSDQNRALTASCAGDPTLDCTSSAIMNHILVVGLNGQLQPWDNAALNAVYGNAPSCPAVVAGAPQANTVSGGFQLFVNASGGSAFSYFWYAGASPVTASPAGAGMPLFVSPSVTTSYWCRITNNCGNTADSTNVQVTIVPCVPPQITGALKDQTVNAGTSVTLSLDFVAQGATVSWFQGSNPNPIAFGQFFITVPITQTTQFRAHVANACGVADSNVATITIIPPRRRTVRH